MQLKFMNFIRIRFSCIHIFSAFNACSHIFMLMTSILAALVERHVRGPYKLFVVFSMNAQFNHNDDVDYTSLV